jgi:hypothetical protein
MTFVTKTLDVAILVTCRHILRVARSIFEAQLSNFITKPARFTVSPTTACVPLPSAFYHEYRWHGAAPYQCRGRGFERDCRLRSVLKPFCTMSVPLTHLTMTPTRTPKRPYSNLVRASPAVHPPSPSRIRLPQIHSPSHLLPISFTMLRTVPTCPRAHYSTQTSSPASQPGNSGTQRLPLSQYPDSACAWRYPTANSNSNYAQSHFHRWMRWCSMLIYCACTVRVLCVERNGTHTCRPGCWSRHTHVRDRRRGVKVETDVPYPTFRRSTYLHE